MKKNLKAETEKISYDRMPDDIFNVIIGKSRDHSGSFKLPLLPKDLKAKLDKELPNTFTLKEGKLLHDLLLEFSKMPHTEKEKVELFKLQKKIINLTK